MLRSKRAEQIRETWLNW